MFRHRYYIPGVQVFLSEKISQDPLEKFFESHHQRGAVNDNPNIQQLCYNTQALRKLLSGGAPTPAGTSMLTM